LHTRYPECLGDDLHPRESGLDKDVDRIVKAKETIIGVAECLQHFLHIFGSGTL